MPRKTTFAASLALAAALSGQAFAQMTPGPLVLTNHPLRDGVYWITGGVSNTAFIVGDKGVIVFDVQRSLEGGQKVLAEVAKVTPKPVNEVVLSHADPDHLAGLPAFATDIPIVSQENTKAIIQASIVDPNGGPLFGPMYKALANRLPTVTVGDALTQVVDGVTLELIHTAPAHTAADLALYAPEKKVVFAGDLLVNNMDYPVIHYGGSSIGWIESMKTILALDADIYVPGHGPMELKAQLQARLQKAIEVRDAIKVLVNQGKSLEETEQAFPNVKSADPRFPTFVEVVYGELSKGYPPAHAPWADLAHK